MASQHSNSAKVPVKLPRRKWGNRVLRAGTFLLARLPLGRRPASPKRVLVIRLGNVGDIIVALPVFLALRKLYPDAHFTLLTSPTRRGAPGAAEVLANASVFDEKIIYYEDESGRPRFLLELAAKLRALEIDLAVMLPGPRAELRNLAKHLAMMVAVGVRRTAGFRLVEGPELTVPTTDTLLKALEPLGPVAMVPVPWLVPSEADRGRVAEWLAAAPAGPIVAMQCGAKRPINRWPRERFVAVGRHLIEDRSAWVVLTGSAGEAEANAAVARVLGERCLDLSGQTTVSELAALMERCRLVVSNDTGVMHVAAAVGTPVVAIFSGRDYPNLWHPYGDCHVVLRKQMDCSPCHAQRCPLYPVPECLCRITIDEVVQAVDELLKAR